LTQAGTNLQDAETKADANPNDSGAQAAVATAQAAYDTAVENFKSAGTDPDSSANSSSSSSSDDKP
jgi:hypothetical protein